MDQAIKDVVEIKSNITSIQEKLLVLEVVGTSVAKERDNDVSELSWVKVASRGRNLEEARVVSTAAAEIEERVKKNKNIVISGIDFTMVNRETTIESIITSFLVGHGIDAPFQVVRRMFDREVAKAGVIKMIVIKVESEDIRNKILAKVKPRLNGLQVFLNSDKTALELRDEYNLRQEMRNLVKAVPESDMVKPVFYIKNKSIYKYIPGIVGHARVHGA